MAILRADRAAYSSIPARETKSANVQALNAAVKECYENETEEFRLDLQCQHALALAEQAAVAVNVDSEKAAALAERAAALKAERVIDRARKAAVMREEKDKDQESQRSQATARSRPKTTQVTERTPEEYQA